MRLAVINPNATASMSRSIAAAAGAAAAPDAEIVTLTNRAGPPSIQGVVDAAYAVPGLLGLIQAHEDVDAFVIACFDDTGLDAARSVAARPVVGIGEAACQVAKLIACRFSIITTLQRSVPVLRGNLEMRGLERSCASVLATGVPVLALENATKAVLAGIDAAIQQAIERDGAEAIVLGCAGMAPLAQSLSSKFDIPVVDGVASAVGLASTLVRMRLNTSRRGFYSGQRASPTGMPKTPRRQLS